MAKVDKLTADNLSRIVNERFHAARQWRRSYKVLGKSIDDWFVRVDNAMNKVHDPDFISEMPGASSYFGLTMLKVNAATARLKTTYAHALDAPFILKPSAEPELSKDSKLKVERQLTALLIKRMQGFGLRESDLMRKDGVGLNDYVAKWLRKNRDSVRNAVLEEERKIAAEAAAYHHAYMRKQFIDGNWMDAATGMFYDLIAKPYTVICAGEYMPRTDLYWDGNKAKERTVLAPSYRYVKAEDAYIGSDASSAQNGSGFTEVVERTYMELAELMRLKKPNGETVYEPEQIKKVLHHYVQDCSCGLDWLGIVSDAGDFDTWRDDKRKTMKCLVHQGVFSGKELEEVGLTGYGDDTEFHECTIEVAGNVTIRVEVGSKRKYFSATYKKYGDSYAGASVAMMLHDRQREVNRLLYSKNRNSWHASGPTVLMNGHFFQHPEDVSLAPYATAWANPNNQSGQNWAMQQVNVQPIFGALHDEIRRTMVLADEECGVPSLFSGLSRGGVSRTTLGGAVLEQTNGEMGMNDAILNLDKGIIEPIVKAQYFENLSESTNSKHIRGDIEIEGRGIFSLREKELQQRLRQQALPLLMNTTQGGLTPKPILEQTLKEYFEDAGIDTTMIAGSRASQEVASAGLNPPQTNDGRTFNQQQSMIGVAQ